MGNYKARKPGFIAGWQTNVARMQFQGKSDEEIITVTWPELVEAGKMEAGRQRLRRLRHDEKYNEYYRTLITEWSAKHVGKALNRLAQQIDDPNGWLANKAANDVLAQSKQFTGSDENTVVVKVEGMPELGVPEE